MKKQNVRKPLDEQRLKIIIVCLAGIIGLMVIPKIVSFLFSGGSI